jgi:hypothetical protein
MPVVRASGDVRTFAEKKRTYHRKLAQLGRAMNCERGVRNMPKALNKQPSEAVEGNRSIRRVGEKVAELARLPWVFQRAALNPARG